MAASRSRSRRLTSSAAAVGERAAAVGSTPPTANKQSRGLRNNRRSEAHQPARANGAKSKWRAHTVRGAVQRRCVHVLLLARPLEVRKQRAALARCLKVAKLSLLLQDALQAKPPLLGVRLFDGETSRRGGWCGTSGSAVEASLVLLACGRGAVVSFAADTAAARTSRSSSLRDCRSATSATWLMQTGN